MFRSLVKWGAVMLMSGCVQVGACDMSGECHPDRPLNPPRPVLLRMVDDPAPLHPGSKDAYAFALIDSGPFCQVFLPKPLGPSDHTWQTLLWHELRHCAEGNYHG